MVAYRDMDSQIVSSQAREVVRRSLNHFKLDRLVADSLMRLVARSVVTQEIRFPASEEPVSRPGQFLMRDFKPPICLDRSNTHENYLPTLRGNIFDNPTRRRYLYLPLTFWPHLNVEMHDIRIDCSTIQAQLILENLAKKHCLRWAFDAFKEAVYESILPNGRLYSLARDRCKAKGMD